VLHAAPRPSRRGSAGCREAAHRHIGPTTCVPDWYGDRLHLGNAVDALVTFAPLPPPDPEGAPRRPEALTRP
jgi:hypothetical protein